MINYRKTEGGGVEVKKRVYHFHYSNTLAQTTTRSLLCFLIIVIYLHAISFMLPFCYELIFLFSHLKHLN